MTTARRPLRTSVPAVAAVACVAAAALAAALLPRRLTRVEVAGESMTPELMPGDFLVLWSGAPSDTEAYGRIVATRDPRSATDDAPLLLKRVVGLPGEALRIGGGVQVNGRYLLEPYAHGQDPTGQHRGVQRLAEASYFLLGDNRAASTDGRDFGPTGRDRIIGTAVWRYWPPERFGRLRRPPRRFLGLREDEATAPSA
ncbi:MAG: signal peptidase I [Dehalococcoidia bacterium]